MNAANPVFRIARKQALAVIACLACAVSYAFGPTGHRAIARIAENHISPQTAAAVSEILGKETLVEVSTWPDWIRSDPDWDHSAPWHYINVPDGKTYGQSKKNPAGDAYVKLVEFLETLRNDDAPIAEKAVALKWVVHLVGDLHQPLHVGRAEDRGGNDTKAVWFGRNVNMHSVWDTDLIEYTDYSFSELAESIDRRVEVAIEPGPAPDIAKWIEESYRYRDRAYKTPEPNHGGTYRYIFENLPLLEQRLKQAGLRLALTLDYALSDGKAWSGMPMDLHWMRNSAEYPAVTRQVFALATLKLEAMKRDGKLPNDGRWAVSMDADETIFDNSQYAKESRGAAFDETTWDAWCRRAEATAVPGSVAFARRVKELGGRLAIVSNRHTRTQMETVANLRSLGVEFDVVLLKQDSSDKSPRWKAIETGATDADLPPLEIVMYVGDNIYDFPGQSQELRNSSDGGAYDPFGEVYFVLPNPNYGSFARNPRL